MQLLHHLPLQMGNGYLAAQTEWDADLSVRRDAAGVDWPQTHFDPGSDLVLDPARDHRDAGAERSACRAPAFRAAAAQRGVPARRTGEERHKPDGARFGERSVCAAVARAVEYRLPVSLEQVPRQTKRQLGLRGFRLLRGL